MADSKIVSIVRRLGPVRALRPPAKAKPELPAWRTGTDRQRGRALWRYLRATGDVFGLKREGRKLVPTTPLRVVLLGSTPRFGAGSADWPRDVYASIGTALDLAARGEFVAAGAVYFLVMQRIAREIEPEARHEWNLHKRQQGAKKARDKNVAKAKQRAQKLMSALRRQSSSESITMQPGIRENRETREKQKDRGNPDF